jgi:hypothetical protein
MKKISESFCFSNLDGEGKNIQPGKAVCLRTALPG